MTRTLHEIAEELRNSQTVGFASLAAIADELDAMAERDALAAEVAELRAVVAGARLRLDLLADNLRAEVTDA